MMNPNEQKNILLCEAGLTPQVIAETIRALAKERGTRVDEVRVIQNSLPDFQNRNFRFDKSLIDLCKQYCITLSCVQVEDQAQANNTAGCVEIILAKDEIIADGILINLTPRELFFYVMFANFRIRSANDGIASLNDLTVADFDRTLRQITKAGGRELGIRECHRSKRFKFLEVMVAQLISASRKRETDIEDFKSKLLVTFARIKRKIRAAGLPQIYSIAHGKKRGDAGYGLLLAPEHIHFVSDSADTDSGNIAQSGNHSLAA